MGQVIAVMDVGGTSIKTGAVRFGEGGDDPLIEVGPALPTNSNEAADVVLDSLAAGAGAGVDRVLTMTVGTGLGTCLTERAVPLEFIDSLRGDVVEADRPHCWEVL